MKSSHFNKKGEAHMVDISSKKASVREAVASCKIYMKQKTLEMIESVTHNKGDVLSVARIAGITGAKKTSDLIPLCHPIGIESVKIDFFINIKESCVEAKAICKTSNKTGIEMEAMTAVTIAALTVYDMCKSVDKGISINSVNLLKKTGGKSGLYKKND